MCPGRASERGGHGHDSSSHHAGGLDERADRMAGRTGKLELLLRNAAGSTFLQPVTGGEIAEGPVCWARSRRAHRRNFSTI